MILPVILAGGSGERLWPMSRKGLPKQFINPLVDNNDLSLFQTTVQRFRGPVGEVESVEKVGSASQAGFLEPLIVCHEEYKQLVIEQLKQIDCNDAVILLEPHSRNTAPAIALATQWAQIWYPDAIMVVLPSDHLINEQESFVDAIKSASETTKESIVIFGIPVTEPETGYGYIEIDRSVFGSPAGPHVGFRAPEGPVSVKRFVEKPNITIAKTFMDSGNYLWNSGIFMFSPSVFLNELALYSPDILDCCGPFGAIEPGTGPVGVSCPEWGSVGDPKCIIPDVPRYSECRSVSIDYAVMEHTKVAKVYVLNNPWSDIGNWNSVWNHSIKDNNENCICGTVVTYDTSRCLIRSQTKLISTIGLHDLIIIETDGAILVANKNQSQDLKNIISELKSVKYESL